MKASIFKIFGSMAIRGLFTMLLTIVSLPQMARAQSCVPVTIQNKTASAGPLNKDGYAECQASTPPKYFLQKTTAETDTESDVSTGSGGCPSGTTSWSYNSTAVASQTMLFSAPSGLPPWWGCNPWG